MSKKIVFMFSGQGSQYFQMGKELYANNKQFNYWMDHCSDILYPWIQTSLIEELYQGKGRGEAFDNLLYTNPALLSIQYSMYKVLEQMNIKPDILLGYSLGEYVTSIVSGAVSLKEGLQLVVEMAKLVQENTAQTKMLAIMAPELLMTENPELFKNCTLTGSNFNENFVVCGLPEQLQALQVALQEREIISQFLPVNYGFHTEHINPIEEIYKLRLQKSNILPPQLPVISTLKRDVIQEFNPNYFWEIIRYPVNFHQTVHAMLAQDDYIFIDLGPSGSLATFMKYILNQNSHSVALQTINPYGRDLIAIEKLHTMFSNQI